MDDRTRWGTEAPAQRRARRRRNSAFVIVGLLTIAAIVAVPLGLDGLNLVDLPGERTADALGAIMIAGVVIAFALYAIFGRSSDGD